MEQSQEFRDRVNRANELRFRVLQARAKQEMLQARISVKENRLANTKVLNLQALATIKEGKAKPLVPRLEQAVKVQGMKAKIDK